MCFRVYIISLVLNIVLRFLSADNTMLSDLIAFIYDTTYVELIL